MKAPLSRAGSGAPRSGCSPGAGEVLGCSASTQGLPLPCDRTKKSSVEGRNCPSFSRQTGKEGCCGVFSVSGRCLLQRWCVWEVLSLHLGQHVGVGRGAWGWVCSDISTRELSFVGFHPSCQFQSAMILCSFLFKLKRSPAQTSLTDTASHFALHCSLCLYPHHF